MIAAFKRFCEHYFVIQILVKFQVIGFAFYFKALIHGLKKVIFLASFDAFYPFTAPSINPLTKYFCINGYTHKIGIAVTIATVYCMDFVLSIC